MDTRESDLVWDLSGKMGTLKTIYGNIPKMPMLFAENGVGWIWLKM